MPPNESCETYQPLMSGYLDGELGVEDRATLEAHLDECPNCREEFEQMKKLVAAAGTIRMEDPPDEVWDTFLDNVYNRVERRFGWLLTILGVAVLTLYGIYLFVTNPWGSAMEKFLVATPIVGLALVFVSVLRQRLRVAKMDRYTKEVNR